MGSPSMRSTRNLRTSCGVQIFLLSDNDDCKRGSNIRTVDVLMFKNFIALKLIFENIIIAVIMKFHTVKYSHRSTVERAWFKNFGDAHR